MKELSQKEVLTVSGAIKFHFNVVQIAFTAIGAAIFTGPVGAAVIIAGAIATQGVGNLHDMYVDEHQQR